MFDFQSICFSVCVVSAFTAIGTAGLFPLLRAIEVISFLFKTKLIRVDVFFVTFIVVFVLSLNRQHCHLVMRRVHSMRHRHNC